jgi:hypothetical protein
MRSGGTAESLGSSSELLQKFEWFWFFELVIRAARTRCGSRRMRSRSFVGSTSEYTRRQHAFEEIEPSRPVEVPPSQRGCSLIPGLGIKLSAVILAGYVTSLTMASNLAFLHRKHTSTSAAKDALVCGRRQLALLLHFLRARLAERGALGDGNADRARP